MNGSSSEKSPNINILNLRKSGLRARIMASRNNSDDIVYSGVLLVMLSWIIEIFESILIGIIANLIKLIHICNLLTIRTIIGSVLMDNWILTLIYATLTIFFKIFIVSDITQCAICVSLGINKYDILWLTIIEITSKLIEFVTITRNRFGRTTNLCKMVNMVTSTHHMSSCKNFCLNHAIDANLVVNCKLLVFKIFSWLCVKCGIIMYYNTIYNEN